LGKFVVAIVLIARTEGAGPLNGIKERLAAAPAGHDRENDAVAMRAAADRFWQDRAKGPAIRLPATSRIEAGPQARHSAMEGMYPEGK
jgi:hypothetical protein